MEGSRTVKSDTLLRHASEPEETTLKKQPRNIVEVQQKTQPLSPRAAHRTVHQPRPQPLPQSVGTAEVEQIRLKGQEKLLYLRKCRQEQLSNEDIFKGYPFSRIGGWIPNDCILRDDQGQICGSIVEDESGVHLVEKANSGEVKKDASTLNGAALSLLKSGGIFEGIYHDGQFCGLGYELQPCGNTYVGQFKDGNKHGQGTYYWFSTEESYSGEWQTGLPHGYGTYEGKDSYEGTFANGLKFGHGVESFSNGDKYVGQYINGVCEGYGQYSWADGSVYKGDFKHGLRHGYGIWFDHKQEYRGNYRIDQKEGIGVYTWLGKQVYRGQFRQDFRQGYGQLLSITSKSLRLQYRGCWAKGVKKQNSKIDKEAAKRLYVFLEERQKYEELLGEMALKARPKPKPRPKEQEKAVKIERVGHRNCIPAEPQLLHGRKRSPGGRK